MAQVVIFAPVGEDVSAGEQALKDAGHEVEVVEATAVNLLHMAVGMLDGETEEEPAEEAPAEEPPAEEAPAEETAEEPAEADEEPKTEQVKHLAVSVDDERIDTYIDSTRSYPLLRVLDISGDSKVSYKLNESVFSFWRDSGNTPTIRVEGKYGMACSVKMGKAKKKPHLVLDEVTAKQLGLM